MTLVITLRIHQSISKGNIINIFLIFQFKDVLLVSCGSGLLNTRSKIGNSKLDLFYNPYNAITANNQKDEYQRGTNRIIAYFKVTKVTKNTTNDERIKKKFLL